MSPSVHRPFTRGILILSFQAKPDGSCFLPDWVLKYIYRGGEGGTTDQRGRGVVQNSGKFKLNVQNVESGSFARK